MTCSIVAKVCFTSPRLWVFDLKCQCFSHLYCKTDSINILTLPNKLTTGLINFPPFFKQNPCLSTFGWSSTEFSFISWIQYFLPFTKLNHLIFWGEGAPGSNLFLEFSGLFFWANELRNHRSLLYIVSFYFLFSTSICVLQQPSSTFSKFPFCKLSKFCLFLSKIIL